MVSTSSPLPVSEKELFRQQLGEIVDQSGLSLVEFARLLEAETRTPVHPTRLSAWLKGRGYPKTSETRYELLSGAFRLQKILETTGTQQERKLSAARWLTGAEVRAKFEDWLQQGMTLRQIVMAGQVSETIGALWRSGALTRVDRLRFNRFQLYVEHWLKVLKDSGSLDTASGDQVSRLMQEWESAGLSADEIRVVAEIPPSVYSKWTSGQAVPRAHFERVQLMVTHWLQVKAAREAGAAVPVVDTVRRSRRVRRE